ncbi:hypothetical protein C8Z91_04450 [Paenibacillus elgii]|uniref:Uncharacterized protein n=1 Tax=Paenibacillus elgii TaxID=189691 RepID=A0A2T6G886_9BACL|nr:hypothetical protein [Paenibacillus elgii]PUA40361.1 hypothetical protein C8Z91_04450 [Paenibacillus elgii]
MSKPIAKINELLGHWASLSPPIVDFTVENVMSAINYEATYDYIFRLLLSKNGFEIIASRIYLCPNTHKAYHCGIDQEIDGEDLPECHICGKEIVNDLDHSFLVFNFSEEFIEDAKKKILRMRSLKDQVGISSILRP